MSPTFRALRKCLPCGTDLSETDMKCQACGDVRSVLHPEVEEPVLAMELLRAWRAARGRYLASLGPEERAEVEAREAEHDRAHEAFENEEVRLYEEANRLRSSRERKSRADRKAGRVATQTELGRPFGLTAQRVGRILDEHGLRDLVQVSDEEYEARVPGSMEMWVRTSTPRRAAFMAEHPPVIPVTIRKRPEPEDEPFEPLLMRGVLEGFATSEGYWIVDQVLPLIHAHLAKS